MSTLRREKVEATRFVAVAALGSPGFRECRGGGHTSHQIIFQRDLVQGVGFMVQCFGVRGLGLGGYLAHCRHRQPRQ